MIEYIVYLGENNTTKFDVGRNTQHTLDLNINGEDEIDNRVRVFEEIYYGKQIAISALRRWSHLILCPTVRPKA